MSRLSAVRLLAAAIGVAPAGVGRQYGLELVAGLCGAAGVVVVLTAAYVEMALAWGAQPARVAIAAALIAAALAAHAAGQRRRRLAEEEALRTRAEIERLFGIAQDFIGSGGALGPVAAFAAAFLATRRR